MELSESARVLWGKTGPNGSWHPLICHMIDVGAVASELWATVLTSAVRRRLAEGLGLPEDAAGRWVAYLAGLHDLGKATPAFAARGTIPQAVAVRRLLPAGSRSPDCHHGVATAWLSADTLCEWGIPRRVANVLATTIGGHHGTFRADEPNYRALGSGPWDAARLELTTALAAAGGLIGSVGPTACDHATGLRLAGLVSVADWIGSAQDCFPPLVPPPGDLPTSLDLAAYAEQARAGAADALHKLGWLAAPAATQPCPFAALFPELSAPRPIQLAVAALAPRLSGPFLLIAEAPMGEGKTEAALFAADYAGATLGARGTYFALPTMATSDQMFGRVQQFLSDRFAHVAGINLQLLHGHAALSAAFGALRDAGDALFQPSGVDSSGGSDASVVAAEWFTHRKRGLLAPFGVGTVDQTLLAVLQARHCFVRLFGLADKVLVLDEVHAYDAYMTALIERLLEWLGALGAPVILLSATLPASRRERLLAAYGRGLGRTDAAGAPSVPYPRLTWIDEHGPAAVGFAASAASRKHLGLRWVDGSVPADPTDPYALGEQLAAALAGGGCAAVVCNTVRRAQEVYRALCPYFRGAANDGEPELQLLHSRFPFAERAAREQRALRRFGKPAGKAPGPDGEVDVRRPQRAVLVSTQIIEQSLDLDFDLLVSDHAPADLLLQRAGRLHRHGRTRPAGLSAPELWLVKPGTDGADLPDFGRADTHVYEEYVLLRSYLALAGREAILIPEEVEALVEAVYADQVPVLAARPALAARLAKTRATFDQTLADEGHAAAARLIPRPNYTGPLTTFTGEDLSEDEPGVHKAFQALTRLTETSVNVVLLWGSPTAPALEPGGQPLAMAAVPSVALARELLLHSLSLSDPRVVYDLLAQPAPVSWRQSPLLRQHRLLALDPAGRAAVGKHSLRLDPELGVLVE